MTISPPLTTTRCSPAPTARIVACGGLMTAAKFFTPIMPMLEPEEYQGGTTSVSNMGMMGVKNFAAVINPPHATILAVGAGEQRVVVKSGEMVIVQAMTVTLSTDHRCVDGALGAELLGAFKRYIENPIGMLV